MQRIYRALMFSAFMTVCIMTKAQTQDKLPEGAMKIPVILVDGVEVQNLDSIDNADIISVDVVKDEKVLQYFYPRMGGLIVVSTQSKRYLKPVLEHYKASLEAAKKQSKDKGILIRGGEIAPTSDWKVTPKTGK